MKKETFLQLHERLLKSDVMGPNFYRTCKPFKAGLCALRFNDDYLSCDETVKLYFDLSNTNTMECPGEYTADRQNIILLCAAINNEL